jgi:16S rRNA A1518/A1519 N6-dimethyltransferase RsmA/KsgA/DIM1 with predicted DNA glycosylase/AP lyase activity
VPQHNDIVRESFTTQAKAFAANPWVTDEERIQRLVAAARLKGDERVLDIATGPGYIAEAFARVAREAIGVDLAASPTFPSVLAMRKISRSNRKSSISSFLAWLSTTSRIPCKSSAK